MNALARRLGLPVELFAPTLQLSVTALLLVAAQTTMKAVRDGVFLHHFGLVGLSYAMLGMALVAGIVTSSYHHWTGSIGRRSAFVWLQVGSAASLVVMGEALHRHLPGMPFVLYVWTGIAGLLALAELWLFADGLFSAYNAKRAFSLIGAGAILGGVIGGVSTRLIAPHHAARVLLWIVAVELLLSAVAMRCVSRHSPKTARSLPRFSDELRVARGNGYVQTLAVIMLCVTVVATTIEWQVKGLAKAHFSSNESQLVAFFGLLGAAVSALALVVQLVGTQRLLRAFGVIPCLRGSPVLAGGVAIGLLATVGFPGAALVTCTLGAVATEGVRMSLDKSASELLYVPLEPSVRAAAKRFIDTVVDRVGGAITAALWLGLVALWHVDRPERLPYASVLVLVTVAIWLGAIVRMRHHYVDAHRRLIGAPPDSSVHATQEQRETIVRLLQDLDEEAHDRTRALRRLNALQAGAPLDVPWHVIAPHIAREIHDAHTLTNVLGSDLCTLGREGQRLAILVEKSLRESLERVARLLALVYPPEDLLAMRRALNGSSPRVRDAAIELLDNMLIGPGRDDLIRLVAERYGATPLSHAALDVDGALALLAGSADARLAACAVAVLSQTRHAS